MRSPIILFLERQDADSEFPGRLRATHARVANWFERLLLKLAKRRKPACQVARADKDVTIGIELTQETYAALLQAKVSPDTGVDADGELFLPAEARIGDAP